MPPFHPECLPLTLYPRVEIARPESDFLAMVEPREAGVAALPWAQENSPSLQKLLHRHGAVWLRGFETNVEDFAKVADLFSPLALSRKGQVSPRHQVSGSVYTATDLPANHGICQHQEMAYDIRPPSYILFYCRVAPPEGGETPIADARELYRSLSESLLEKFAREGVLYQRNFSPECPYQSAEQTFGFETREELSRYAEASAIQCEWVNDTYLRTLQRRGAITTHPVTGDRIFFNLAHLWHWSNNAKTISAFSDELASKVRNTAPRDQWYNSFYGDGSDIEQSVVDEIHERYRELEVAIPWRPNDILILDNVLASHGRRAFSGTREILATIRGPWTSPYEVNHTWQ